MQVPSKKVGLILPGGGARAAYQVGVLRAIAQMMPRGCTNPFPIISGTSAGAVNATVLASRAERFRVAVSRLARVWGGFESHQVFYTDAWTTMKSSLHWLSAVVFGGLGVANPKSLLDNQPLRELLDYYVDFSGIQRNIDAGHVDALAVTGSGYSSARSVTWFQGREDIEPWARARRVGRAERIGLDHVMASVAIPLIFPPVRVGYEYFADGVIRQTTPLSAAIHLGADRLLVIGVRNEVVNPPLTAPSAFPSFGQIAGYMLDTLFADSLYADLETLSRVNQLVVAAPETARQMPGGELKPIHTLVIIPSADVIEIATRHAKEMPIAVRTLLRGLGAGRRSGAQLISYLLFESAYTKELMQLGYRDGLEAKGHLLPFLAGEQAELLDAPVRIRSALSGEKGSAQP